MAGTIACPEPWTAVRLFKSVEKEVLRKQQLWLVADYCGLHVITYSLMINHFHLFIYVPKKSDITDAELVRRYEWSIPIDRRPDFRGSRRFVLCSQKTASMRKLGGGGNWP